jgi:hypothetical protein
MWNMTALSSLASRRLARCGTLLLAAALATACSSSGSSGSSSSPPATGPAGSATSSSPPSAPAGGGSPPGTAASGGSPADAATTAAITKAYRDLFDSSATTPQSQAALQHGSAFHQVLVQQGKNTYSNTSGVKLGGITVSGDLAHVTFTITSKGRPLLSNVRGFAVREGGRWLVAAATFCSLLSLQGDAPPACHDPSITALPK